MLTSYTFTICLFIIILHYVADFIFQFEEWAITKKNSFTVLLKHTLTYSTIMTIGLASFFPSYLNMFFFFVLTFGTHTILDYHSSKVIGRMFDRKEFYSGKKLNVGAFSMIGLDQVIHYACLFTSFYITLW